MKAACVCAAALLLTGCTPAPPPAPAVSYRDASAVLAGTTRFDADRMAGDWVTRACIGACAPSTSFGTSLTGAVVETAAGSSRAYVQTGPGILRTPEGDAVLVVMWVDEGFRTAVLGTAAGDSARILDRAPDGGADRIEAARQMLDFNGWDIGQLRTVK